MMDPLPSIADQPTVPRALQGFRLTEVPLYRFDCVVLGSGAAGCCAALSAGDEGAAVAVLSKSGLSESNTRYAQGGVAAVLSASDSLDSHVADTCLVGCGLSDPEVVRDVVSGGPDAIRRLQHWGARFDRTRQGDLALGREGGHSHPRVLHALGDATGLEIQRTLLTAIESHPRVTAFGNTYAIDLLFDENGRVCGVLAENGQGDRVGFTAGQVILATGGAGQLYRETTNPVIATGDGVALAFRAGATIRDPEFFQFHPTCLYIAGAARVLVSEIVRGAGGQLRDRNGRRFMLDAHPDAELAPRDVVSRAVFETMVATDDTSVYLDLSNVEGDSHVLFPSISRTCRLFGIDIARDPIPVRPGLHYMVGGIKVDADGRTDVNGLWAVGECASTGLHGANRLASNSLLEGLVLGYRLGRAAAASVEDVRRGAIRQVAAVDERCQSDVAVNIQDVTYSLKSLMWRQMGVVRDGAKLLDALPKIDLWTRAVAALAPPSRATWELLNMLSVARLSVVAALARRESRGVHFRSDFPQTDEAWCAHSELRALGGPDKIEGLSLTRMPRSAEASKASIA
ncbi:L-aspartate oxidase [Engelhardtia mirabilis]|uniref:L-aspartate oxidase n=1 Tax=Engelhardtia mirabilis TaxID=2528011 RepID=A0A518BPI1_9BACT|nr:L-aspartate oxidase [Planctomycetes bacterium Pla133]QDV03205.1 L-aspartate oxidase [Planctomycetes bacterium Pla86]